MDEPKSLPPIPRQTLKRLPEYYAYLTSPACAGQASVSAGKVAQALGRSEIQVRKDLAAVSSTGGKPKKGFDHGELLRDIDRFLGVSRVDTAVLAGVGNLGTALLHYEGFRGCGVEIAAAFDCDPEKIGQNINGVYVLGMDEMTRRGGRLMVHIGSSAPPAAAAQQTAEAMVEAGVLAIWNFAPIRLKVPEGTLIQNEDMACSLAMLSHHLATRLGAGD